VGLAIKLGVVAVALLVILGVGDVVARTYAQDRTASQINQRVPGASSTVNISSFPFVGKLLATGKVDKISAHVKHAKASDFTFDQIDVVLRGVRIDRNQLVGSQHVQVSAISTGTVKASISEQSIDQALQALGQPAVVHLVQGAAELTVAGVTVRSTVTIVNNAVQLTVGHQVVNLPIPQLPVLPCVATAVVLPGQLDLSCTFHQVPTAFLKAAA
jgi:hypothetical protein